MSEANINSFRMNRAPALAAAIFICLGFTPNTLASATNTSGNNQAKIAAAAAPAENGEVLSHYDADLYRAIFAAQAKNDWDASETMTAKLGDKRLLGYVLADRYQHHTTSLLELQAWLAAYRDLPQAETLYYQAQKLPGSRTAKLTHPMGAGTMSGHGYGYVPASGFRSKQHPPVQLSTASRRAAARIEAALRQGDPATAKSLLQAILQQSSLPKAELISLQARLAAGFLYNDDAAEALRLTDVSYMQEDARALWINGLSSYKQGDAATAANAFTALGNRDDLADSDHAAAAFWAYRALKKSGSADEAQHWLEEAAATPHSFYGLLASHLGARSTETSWSWHMPELNQPAMNALAAIPAGGRALALVQIGQTERAEIELRRINVQGRHALQQAMLALAEKSHMAGLALTLGGMMVNDEGKPYDAALYPVPAWQPTGGFRVDRALIYALIRHESQFDPRAVSSQGACGLMQLMPATARLMSGTTTAHASNQCPNQFFDPTINIGLGQNYVRHLSEQPMIGDNLLLLLAAYNAGPGRLSQRTDTDAEDDPLLFIESLPAQETHDYVQQVLIQYWMYRARLRLPLNSLDQLAHGQWPRYALHDTAPTREADVTLPSTGFAVASNVTVH